MLTIVLLTSPSLVSDEEVITTARMLAGKLGATLIVTDNPVDIHHRSVDLLLWMPGIFDAEVYNQLHAFCPRLAFLVDVRTRTGRMAAPEGPRLPRDIVTILAPFQDFEEVCSLITINFGWPPKDVS